MENPYLVEFRESIFEEETAVLLQKTQEAIQESMDSIKSSVLLGLSGFFKKIKRKQEQGASAAGYINLSFLYTSIYFHEPALLLSAYGEKWIMEENAFAEMELGIPWLFTEWDAYISRLLLYRKKHLERRVREEAVYMLVRRAQKRLIYLGMLYLKYILQELSESEELKEIEKHASFYLSYGEYMDWQRTMYAEQPEIPLGEDSEEAKTFRRYDGKKYFKKEIKDLNVSGSRFTRCRFQSGSLKNLIMNDCIFEDCVFEQMELETITCYGTAFRNCWFFNLSAKDIRLGSESRKDTILDLFQNTMFLSCSFQNIKIIESDLSDIEIMESRKCNISAADCGMERAEFQFGEEEEGGIRKDA